MSQQAKTTRAFRTISEAAEELDLQPHVLRFWESKFPNFSPIKRGGGRRFYRPEDIEFLRGIKILLHDERHPIKDVQKLIRVKGVNRVIELGRSIQQAAIPKDVKDTNLVPDRIQASETESTSASIEDTVSDENEFEDDQFFPESDEAETDPVSDEPEYVSIESDDDIPTEAEFVEPEPVETSKPKIYSIEPVPSGLSDSERADLEKALERLLELRQQWQEFKTA